MQKLIRWRQQQTKLVGVIHRSFTQNRSSFEQQVSEEYKQSVDRCNTRNHRLINLLVRNQYCQFTSFANVGGEESSLSSNVKSTNVPYVTIPKSVANQIFETEENNQLPKAKKSAAVGKLTLPLEQLAQSQTNEAQPRFKLSNYEVVYCMMANSPHVANLSQDEDKNQMFNTRMISMTVGLSDTKYNDQFLEAGLLPPRGVISGDVEQIPSDSSAFTSIWKEYFRPHPNVSHALKMDQVRMFKLSQIKSAYFVDLSKKMVPVESVKEFVTLQADEIATSKKILNKLNTQTGLLDKMTSKVYGLKLGTKIVFDIDQCGIRLIAKPLDYKVGVNNIVESDQWQEYYLDFGYTINNDAELQQFFMQTQSVI